jgi:hypothetical protein
MVCEESDSVDFKPLPIGVDNFERFIRRDFIV